MPIIKIIIDNNLPPKSGNVSLVTWGKLREKWSSAFFSQNFSQIIVSKDSFELAYVLTAVGGGVADDTLYVSSDVKELNYPDSDTINY